MKKAFIVPSVILIISVLLSIGTYFFRIEQYKDWIPAEGVVTEVKVFETHRNSSSTHRIYYAYIVDDIKYIGSESFPGETDTYKAGDTHEIWFDPDNPVYSFFHKPKPGLDPIAPLMFGVFLAIATYRTIKDIDKRNRPL